jgi:hypothetical protein
VVKQGRLTFYTMSDIIRAEQMYGKDCAAHKSGATTSTRPNPILRSLFVNTLSLDPSLISTLRSTLSGRLVLPGDPDYDKARPLLHR